jgi:hypothetical protein
VSDDVAPAGPSAGFSPRAVWSELRRNRGKDVPNSRPLPDWVRRFSWWLDDAFAVPGMPGRRVGIDGLVAFVPVVGDMAALALSLVIVAAGIVAGVSIPTILRMLLHLLVESLIGLVPVVGAVFNMAFKANNRNVALIEADLADRRATRRSSLSVLVLLIALVIAALALLVALAVAGVLVLFWLLGRLF